MARKKLYSDNMGDLIEAVEKYRSGGVAIRAKYAALAEKEIAESRERVLELMFVKHAESGPSEIANTTGISRTTVIRWRREFLEKLEEDPTLAALMVEEDEALPEEGDEPDISFGMERSHESNSDVHYVKRAVDEFKVYFPVADFFCEGEDPDEAEQSNPITRPDWLTDDVMQQAESITGVRIPYAPWHKQ